MFSLSDKKGENMKRILLLAPLALMACEPNDPSMVGSNPPFYAYSKKLPNGTWEMQIDGMYPSSWSCKGLMRGTAEDSFDLPAQTIPLTCVEGPTSGIADFRPISGSRFAEFQYRLNNGLSGKTTFR